MVIGGSTSWKQSMSRETSSCLDLPIYDEYDDEHVELPSCDAMLHR